MTSFTTAHRVIWKQWQSTSVISLTSLEERAGETWVYKSSIIGTCQQHKLIDSSDFNAKKMVHSGEPTN